MRKVAIMQPYFLPYAGYFRLFLEADVFVALDCVQFPKGGWVNRNRMLMRNGAVGWLTAPFARGPLRMRIDELRFSDGAQATMSRRMSRFPVCVKPPDRAVPIVSELTNMAGSGCDYLVRLLILARNTLQLGTPIVLASDLQLPDGLAGVDRVYEICRNVRADVFINPPGGRAIYSSDEFARRGVRLRLQPKYRGSRLSILQRLAEASSEEVRAEVEANLT